MLFSGTGGRSFMKKSEAKNLVTLSSSSRENGEGGDFFSKDRRGIV
jgi:hypothetical protein